MNLERISIQSDIFPFWNFVKKCFTKGGGLFMGKSNKVCPNCGRKMKQQFIGLQHCKCGISWTKDSGFFERDSDMVFALEKNANGRQNPVIRHK